MTGSDEKSDGLLVSDNIKTGYIRGLPGIDHYKVKEVTYTAVDGQAVFEGCIMLGPVEKMDQLKAEVEATPGVDFLNEVEDFGLTVLSRNLWPLGYLPYRIDPGLTDQQRVHDAIAHWEKKTEIRFKKRTNESDFVTFQPGSGCAAHVGRMGGEQVVMLGTSCTLGNAIHEIGHGLGLWHEQGRSDRDAFVKVHFDNVIDGREHNFNQHINDGVDRGGYDYGSIMHYGSHFFSKNGKATITAKDGSEIGQRDGLSAGDIATIAEAYADEFAKRS